MESFDRPVPEIRPARVRRAACVGLLLAAVACAVAPAGATTPTSGTPGAVAAPKPAVPVPIGAPLREATLNGLNGPSRRLGEFRGRPLIINVWASWCGPCRAESASLERLAWRDEARHFAIIGISTDDYRDRAQAWLQQSNATISHYIDRQLEMEHMLGASQLPLTVLVDADGRVLARIYGAKQWDGPEALQFIRKTFRLK